jgi:hypothetical protein
MAKNKQGPATREPAAPEDLEERLILTWPQPRLAVFTTDLLELEVAKVTNGIQSHLMMLQNVLNVSREEALEHIAQMKKDDDDLKAAYPEMSKVTGLPDPPEDDGGPGGDSDKDEDDYQRRESNSEVSP